MLTPVVYFWKIVL